MSGVAGQTEPDAWGRRRPRLVVPPPGPRSRALARELARRECRNVTYLAADFPVFWEAAFGANVRDVDGNEYVDLTAAFGVAAAGHAHPAVVAAVQEQAARLLHGMGDVHPPAIKVALLRALVNRTPAGLDRVFLANTGAEAVETALKTAALASGRPRVLVFSGGYHGLTYGALAVSGRRDFRAPFAAQLPPTAVVVPYPSSYRNPWGVDDPETAVRMALREVEHRLADPGAAGEGIGAVLVEPVQARGGVVAPPPSFLQGLRRLCDAHGALLILDEVFTGFGRTGRWFACEHADVVPDLLVVGKALTGGMPLSAVIGTARAMDAWPPSDGEALHTSTFLGHPVGCAAALAELEVLARERLPERAAALGAEALAYLRDALADCAVVGEVRGLGLLIGIELVHDRQRRTPAPDLVGRAVVEGLRRGLVLLGGGVHRNVLTLSPPLAIDADLWRWALREVVALIRGLAT